jgi:hypothetical protein
VIPVAKQSFVGVGVSLASDDVDYIDFDSDASLLDWDVALFRPDISGFYAHEYDQYQGKRSLSDGASFRLKERCEHWRREIKDAVEGGKMVVVFLSELHEIWLDSGRREHSGTGRSRQTTRIVSPYNNYASIPAKLSPIGTKGVAMKLSTRGSESIAPYWREFENCSQYKVVLSEPGLPACLLTKKGDKPVGAILRTETSGGALVLLPELDLMQESFVEANADGEQDWTADAAAFANRLVVTLVALHKGLRGTDEATPEPQWAKAAAYALAKESEFKEQLLIAETALEGARRVKETVADDLKKAIAIRGLLFEKGKPLERAILEGLITLGFVAMPFNDANSEFDVVFESEEGRLIGEAEGKDHKAINIDKLRQLSMNIHEDLQREEVVNPAKGVLFGNPFRLSPIEERGAPFTEKTLRSASSSSTALITTHNLYAAVRYVKDTQDGEYARLCREALVRGVGLVTLPAPPDQGQQGENSVRAGDGESI